MAKYMGYRYRYEVRDCKGRLFGASKFREEAERMAARMAKDYERPMNVIDVEPRLYAYHMLRRPFSIGCQPTGVKRVINYDKRTNVDGVRAWATIWYDHELTDAEVAGYELKPASDSFEV